MFFNKQKNSQTTSSKPSSGGAFETSNINTLGQALLTCSEDRKSLFNKDWWYGKVMALSMKNPHFKTQMFRFIDVLPYLKDSQDVVSHLKQYFSEEKKGGLPSLFSFGASVGGSLAPQILAHSIKKNVSEMARLFITGESPEEAFPKLEAARKKNLTFTVDILGEATLSETEALDYQKRYLDLIQALVERSKLWPSHELLDRNHLGPLPTVNISVKLSSLYSQIHVQAWEHTKDQIIQRIQPILDLAVKNNVFINIDMEHFEIKDLTLDIFKTLLSLPKYKDYPHLGIVLQAYLRDSYKDSQTLIKFAQRRQVPFTVRLVKGAYWDSEVIHAKQLSWNIPVYTNKQESDVNYERCAFLFLEHYKSIHLAIGSHNVRSIASVLAKAKEIKVPQKALEVQMLFGMANSFKKALVDLGFRVREYVTIGEMIPGMAYLVRRLLENTSNESFLRVSSLSGHTANVQEKISHLLKDPQETLKVSSSDPELEGFKNEPLTDFSVFIHRQKFETALKKVKAQFPLPNIQGFINNQYVTSQEILERRSPNDNQTLISRFYSLDTNQVDAAIEGAFKAFSQWKCTDPENRANLIDRLADLIAEHRQDIAALEVFEVGKPWTEADGDITEAIDFCRYYAQDMRRLKLGQKVGAIPGEHSHYHYTPKGVVAVIAPWNFPLAILTGMVAGALVTGNTVLIKPAEQSPTTGFRLFELLKQLHLPSGVVQFLPGRGETVGAQIVKDPRVAMIAFTGSKEVGLQIVQHSGSTLSGQKHVKTCMIEMGGKNSIIIDSDADLDEAVQGVIASAFAFSGQKCSACSRVIVLPQNYDLFLSRLIKATESLCIDHPEKPQAFIGPVVDQESYDRLMEVIKRGQKEASLVFKHEVLPDQGHFIPPTIFNNVSPESFLAQEEFFGPVLSIMKAKDIDEAIAIANNTEFGLTAGLYSRSPLNIEKVRHNLEAGNIYINRTITGAMVDRHPFGGFKLSGLGSKTGGPDYLKQFMNPRVVTENTMRRGFSPDLVN